MFKIKNITTIVSKRNFIYILFISAIIGLIFKKIAWYFGGVLFVLPVITIIINYILRIVEYKSIKNGSKLILIQIYIYSIFTLVGILCRQQFWNLPFWYLLYKYVWPIISILIIMQICIFVKNNLKNFNMEYKRYFIKEIIIPMAIIIVFAIPTFFTSTETFLKIFKPYSYQEYLNRINQ